MNICLEVVKFADGTVVVHCVQVFGIDPTITTGLRRVISKGMITVGECKELDIDVGDEIGEEDDDYELLFELRHCEDGGFEICEAFLTIGNYSEGITRIFYPDFPELFIELLRRAVENANGEKTKLCPNDPNGNCPFISKSKVVRIGNVR